MRHSTLTLAVPCGRSMRALSASPRTLRTSAAGRTSSPLRVLDLAPDRERERAAVLRRTHVETRYGSPHGVAHRPPAVGHVVQRQHDQHARHGVQQETRRTSAATGPAVVDTTMR